MRVKRARQPCWASTGWVALRGSGDGTATLHGIVVPQQAGGGGDVHAPTGSGVLDVGDSAGAEPITAHNGAPITANDPDLHETATRYGLVH